jgi:hypothetical protein
MVELRRHSSIRLHGAVLNCLIRHGDIFTITSHALLGHFHDMHSLDITLTYGLAADHIFTCADGLATVQLTLDALLT